MASEVVMPQMGFDMEEGTLVRWLKKQGDPVQWGEPVAEIETDKAVVAMEAYASGVLLKTVVGEGQRVPVGTVVAYIGEPGEEAPGSEKAAGTLKSAPPAKADLPPVPAGAGTETAVGPRRREAVASPLARRLAEERGIDISRVPGTGPGGRVTREDVLAYEGGVKEAAPAPAKAVAEAPPQAASVTEAIPLTRMRQAIARRTAQSKREAPHFYVSAAVDMTRAMELREEVNLTLGGETRVSVNDLIVKACALALVKYPAFNASYKEDRLERHPDVNIGIAVALEEGLLLPALLRCQKKSLVEVARESRDLAQRAKEGHLRQDEYTAGTFSVSNLGMYDVDDFIAIIYPPQAAVLAVGAVRKQPVVRDDQVVVRQMMRATLSVDHRVADGAQAAQFLSEVKRLLEDPVALLG